MVGCVSEHGGSAMRAFLLSALSLLALLAPAAAQAAPQVGVVTSLPLTARDSSNIQELGAKTVRFFAYTNQDPAGFDDTVRQVEALGAKPLFVIIGDVNNPPTTPEARKAYADYIGSFAAHFRGRLAGIEVWNEPDGPKFWSGMPPFDQAHLDRDAGNYVELLKAAHDAIRAADASVPIVLGGLTANDYIFLRSIYDHGGKDFFDIVEIHSSDTACNVASPYDFLRDAPGGLINQFSYLGFLSVRFVMVDRGDGGKPIWFSEIGWSSYEGDCTEGQGAGTKKAGVGEANQAKFLLQAMHCLRVLGADYVQRVLLYKLNEEDGDPMNTGYGSVRR